MIGERTSVEIGCFEQVFLIWLPASSSSFSARCVFWKQRAIELSRRKFKNELGQSQADGLVLVVPCRDCLLPYGPKGKSLASSEAQPALGLWCVFRGVLLDGLNTLTCNSSILLSLLGGHFTKCCKHKSENVLVNKTAFFFFFSKVQGFRGVMKFDGMMLSLNGLDAEDLIYNQIHVLQLFIVIEKCYAVWGCLM